MCFALVMYKCAQVLLDSAAAQHKAAAEMAAKELTVAVQEAADLAHKVGGAAAAFRCVCAFRLK